MVAQIGKEFQELIDQVKEGEKRRDHAVQEALAKLADDKSVKEIEAAVKQLEDDRKQLAADFKAQVDRVRKATWDANGNYRGVFANEDQARAFGLQIIEHTCKSTDIRSRAGEILKKDYSGIFEARAQSTASDSTGGALVDPESTNRILRLVENYGVFRRNATDVPMSSDTLNYKKQVGEPTVYLVGEGSPPDESTLTFANVNLTARKWGALIYYPDELAEDTAGLIGELVARSLAWSFSYWEDKVGFNGDGSLAFLRVIGIINKLTGLSDTVAEIAGLQVGSGNAWSELTQDDHLGVVARCPEYALNQAKWFSSLSYFFNVMAGIMLSAGGVTASEVQGRRQLMFLGFPVEIAQAMPKTEANSQVPALFGDLRQAVDFGNRRSLQVKTSDHYKFADGQVTVLATQRQDIEVHSVGNAAASADDQEAGPVVGLITASS